jgi:hypothetical protein
MLVGYLQQSKPKGIVGVSHIGEGDSGGERCGTAVNQSVARSIFKASVIDRSINEPGGTATQPRASGAVFRLTT